MQRYRPSVKVGKFTATAEGAAIASSYFIVNDYFQGIIARTTDSLRAASMQQSFCYTLKNEK
nr:MAG TPA: hypothetical protein [Caudoviricetes sp.]